MIRDIGQGGHEKRRKSGILRGRGKAGGVGGEAKKKEKKSKKPQKTNFFFGGVGHPPWPFPTT